MNLDNFYSFYYKFPFVLYIIPIQDAISTFEWQNYSREIILPILLMILYAALRLISRICEWKYLFFAWKMLVIWSDTCQSSHGTCDETKNVDLWRKEGEALCVLSAMNCNVKHTENSPFPFINFRNFWIINFPPNRTDQKIVRHMNQFQFSTSLCHPLPSTIIHCIISIPSKWLIKKSCMYDKVFPE